MNIKVVEVEAGGGGGGGGGGISSSRGSSLRTCTSVEGAALSHYNSPSNGGWRGCHCEGPMLLSLWALLLWDVLFGPDPPADTFLTPFQDGPLDIDIAGSFHGAQRVTTLCSLLIRIANADSKALMQMVSDSWRKHYGKAAWGVKWGRTPLALLHLLAVGLGGPTLVALCDALAADRYVSRRPSSYLIFNTNIAR